MEVVIGLEEIKMKEEKMKRVLDWLILKRVKDVQKFWGLANYYWQFIKNFVAISQTITWFGEDRSEVEVDGEAWRDIKGEIYKRISVSGTKLDKKMRMEVDALNYAIGGMLSMEYEDGNKD